MTVTTALAALAALAAFAIGGALGFLVCALLTMAGREDDERRAVMLASSLRACLDLARFSPQARANNMDGSTNAPI